MKPLIPSDTASNTVTGLPEREDQSLHDEILTRLRDHIVEGNIPDGGRIPERQLCEMLGISRTPLREVLKVLAAEGLIELLPNRGRPRPAIERTRSRRIVRYHGRGWKPWLAAWPAKTSAMLRLPRSSGCTTRCTASTCTVTCTAISASIN